MRPILLLCLVCAAVAAVVCLIAMPNNPPALHSCCAAAALAVGFAYAVKDAALSNQTLLPDGATSTSSTAFDLLGAAASGKQSFLANCELLLSAPALTTTEAPDTKTITYKIECDADSAFGSPRTLCGALLVQTGAGGAGTAAAAARFRLPTDCERYVRVTATGVATVAAGTGGKKMTVSLVF